MNIISTSRIMFLLLVISLLKKYRSGTSRLKLNVMSFQPNALSELDDDYYLIHFRFTKAQIKLMVQLFQFPATCVLSNGSKFDPEFILCVLLRRLSYPNRLSDIVKEFGVEQTQISRIIKFALNHVLNQKGYLLSDLKVWKDQIETFSSAIFRKCHTYATCIGFVDGTVRPICRPTEGQKYVYSGHKRCHGLKYQMVVGPNGMVLNLYGPVLGTRHDTYLLYKSQLIPQLESLSTLAQKQFCVFGDMAYPLSAHIQCPVKGANLSADDNYFNSVMSTARVSVEWAFGEVASVFSFIDFKKQMKLWDGNTSSMYKAAVLFYNIRTCFREGNKTSQLFGLSPPSAENYLNFPST